MLLMIAQFIAYFNYSNIAERRSRSRWPSSSSSAGHRRAAAADRVDPRDRCSSTSSCRGVIPKWAIFAPIFIPLFLQLGRRAADRCSPPIASATRRSTSITPLMVYLPFMVTIAQRYKQDAGIGTIIALMIPYAVDHRWSSWTLLFVALVPCSASRWGPGTRSSSDRRGRR